MLDKTIAILAPHYCYSCGESGAVLCDCCKNNVFEEPFLACVVCGLVTGAENCCTSHMLPYDRLWCVTRRMGVVEKIIDAYKFQGVRAASQSLAELLDARLPALPEDIVVVPVPTAPRNIRLRGYDHMLLIAAELAKRRGLTVATPLRRRSNVTQHFAKTATDRRLQAKTFFEVRGAVEADRPHLVLDDIFTTGATIESATHQLKQAGVTEVWAAIIARQ